MPPLGLLGSEVAFLALDFRVRFLAGSMVVPSDSSTSSVLRELDCAPARAERRTGSPDSAICGGRELDLMTVDLAMVKSQSQELRETRSCTDAEQARNIGFAHVIGLRK